MSLTPEQYLALSTLAYETLSSSDDISRCIGDIVQKMDRDKVDSLELRALSSLSSWVLVNAYTSPSGMSAIAVQNPETKEVVFVYRGTDAIEKNFTVGIKDWFMDLKIAVGANLTVDDGKNQFVDAQNFYYNTIQKLGGASNISARSFTGHSLGGGLAQYMAYVTAGKYKTVTFDAVGIGQALPGVNPRDYDNTVTDYVNRDDFIGLYGVQLGREVYIENKGSQQYRDRNNSISAGQRLMLQAKPTQITTRHEHLRRNHHRPAPHH